MLRVHINPYTLGLLSTIENNGGTPYIVGGWVRDLVMRQISSTKNNEYMMSDYKDIDVEVYGLTISKLESILNSYKPISVSRVGSSFGVFKVSKIDDRDGDDLDISIPRRESKSGSGHKGFMVEFDPTLTPEQASMRRDFTMNSLMYNPFTGEILDFHGGIADIENKILRHTSIAFLEDPLRVLRAMQFCARFDLKLDNKTRILSKSIKNEYDSLSKERVFEEFNKMFLKGINISAGLKVLENTEWISNFPELFALVGCEQHPDWHPEGDVWEHTKLTVDAGLEIANRESLSPEDKRILLWSCLLHDIGKPAITELEKSGHVASIQHDKVGSFKSRSFLRSINADNKLIETVKVLTDCHMYHANNDFSKRGIRRLSVRVNPSNIKMLCMLMEADIMGRKTVTRNTSSITEIMKVANELKIEEEAPKPILLGRHLLDLGLTPSPAFGVILHEVFVAQLDGEFDDLAGALMWLHERLTKK